MDTFPNSPPRRTTGGLPPFVRNLPGPRAFLAFTIPCPQSSLIKLVQPSPSYAQIAKSKPNHLRFTRPHPIPLHCAWSFRQCACRLSTAWSLFSKSHPLGFPFPKPSEKARTHTAKRPSQDGFKNRWNRSSRRKEAHFSKNHRSEPPCVGCYRFLNRPWALL